MDKKKRMKKYIAWSCIAALVVLLAVMPLAASSGDKTDGPAASVLTAEVVRADIDTRIIGGGTLVAEDAVEITIPASVKLTDFLVENGDSVSEGDPIAAVDRVTVMSAIAEVQETLTLLAEEIDEASADSMPQEVVARAGGTVKILYAREGDNVRDVMLEYGALAVISLDGMMKVTVERKTDLMAGDNVCVTLSDGTEVTGRVESNYDGFLTVTIPDNGYDVGDAVKVTGEDGNRIGSGVLAIHSPWNAVGYYGAISDIRVSEGKTVSAGTTLMTLEDTGYTARYQQLSAQHREYEALMLELFVMYQTETITAPCGGIMTGVDENSASLLADNGMGWTLSLLANAPNGDDETAYTNFIGQVTAVGTDGLILKMNPQQLSITDYLDLSGVPTDPELMTEEVIYAAQAPVYELKNGGWQQIKESDIAQGDILLFAGDGDGNFVWVVRVSRSDYEEPAEPTLPSEPEEPEAETVPSEPSGSGEISEETEGGQPSLPSQNTGGNFQGGGSNSAGFGGAVQEETEPELYGLDTVTVASVMPQNTMTLEITVDEQDVGELNLGQSAQVTLDALTGQIFTATVTEISGSATNAGGSSKFTVELTMERGENMLSGMNAAAFILLDTASQVLTIPVAALQDIGTETVLYTSYDEKTGILGNPVAVTVGVSDGETVQILSGIEEGMICYYPYYDTLEISNAVSGSGFSFGGTFGSIGSGRKR